MKPSTGTLFVVSTPIGNLADLSPRVRQTLETVDYVLSESRSHFNKLGLAMKLIAYQGKGYGSDFQIRRTIADLESGKNIALISDAGTPLISDPGLKLVKLVGQNGIPVISIPGPTAFISAVVVSGLPTKNILFIGFLPKKRNALINKLRISKSALVALDEPGSLAAYVSRYQIERVLIAVSEVFGPETQVSLAREMTKLHEEHVRGTAEEVLTKIRNTRDRLKGEISLVVCYNCVT